MAASSSMMRTLPCPDRTPGFDPLEMTAASDIDSLSHQRELQIEPCAFVRRALYANLARVLLNDSVGQRQAQPGAAALPFLRRIVGCKEWIVTALHVVLR